MLGSLLEKKSRGEKIHFTLIDPDKCGPREAEKIAEIATRAGTDVFLVGGSLGVSPENTDAVVRVLKSFERPVVIFPGALNNVSRHADAALFLTVLNSDDPYYHGIAQVQGAMIVLYHNIEAIPTCYIIVGYGGTAGYILRARPLPLEKHDLIAAHVLACSMMGNQVIYLEAGSGAPQHVPPQAVSLSKKLLMKTGLDPILIVGGGIRTPEAARALAEAGADGIVTGTIAEEKPELLLEIVGAFKGIRSSEG
ncbi:MAG: geranylgeranylglyceryl/heptaprenylglyceryl phosphate synthase [Acidilobaceae archaeon]